MTYPLLKNAPPHHSDEFIDYLRDNNVVVWEDDCWIVIRNCKYYREDRPWFTAFAIGDVVNFYNLLYRFSNYEWKKKRASDQTVKRFHIHMF